MSNDTYHILRLSSEGSGIAERAGKICFIPQTLPGEQVSAKVIKRHKRYDQLELIDVLEAASERQAPSCSLFGACGGCQLQHMSQSRQMQTKHESLLNLFTKAGISQTVPFDAPINSPAFNYRQRARLAVHVPKRGKPKLGFRRLRSNDIIAVKQCPILVEELSHLPAHVNDTLIRLQALRLVGHIELILSETGDGRRFPLIHFRYNDVPPANDYQLLTQLGREHGAYISIKAANTSPQLVHQPCELTPRFNPMDELSLEFLPGDFIQANPSANRAMIGRVIDWLGAPPQKVLDACCGLGNITLPMATAGHRVTGIEIIETMVQRARSNATLNKLTTTDFKVADLQCPNLKIDLTEFDTVVLDPPREGAIGLISAIAKQKPRQVIYVSCNPATLARDVAVLNDAGYSIANTTLIDMFPQTGHSEAMIKLMLP